VNNKLLTVNNKMYQTGSRKCAADGIDIDQLHYLNAECPLWVWCYNSMVVTLFRLAGATVRPDCGKPIKCCRANHWCSCRRHIEIPVQQCTDNVHWRLWLEPAGQLAPHPRPWTETTEKRRRPSLVVFFLRILFVFFVLTFFCNVWDFAFSALML